MSETLALLLQIIAPSFRKISRSEKTKLFLSERKLDFWQNKVGNTLENKRQLNQKNPIVYWVHVASAGELEQVIPILRRLHNQHSVHFFLTYFSPSAIPFIKNCPGLIGATSLPWENKKLYRETIKKLDIKRLILVRYDFWPALISAFQDVSIPFCVVAATFRKARSPLPSFVQKYFRTLWFNSADAIFLVNQSDYYNLDSADVQKEKFFVSGDAKWARAKERVQTVRNNQLSLSSQILQKAINKSGASNRRVVVFGSPHEEEMGILQKFISQKPSSGIIIIVAPKEVDSQTIKACEMVLSEGSTNILKITQCQNSDWLKSFDQSDTLTVILLDTFGLLAEVYAFADLAIIGGGFDGQLHNVLEPAAFSVVTLFGNQALRAHEAQALLAADAALGFSNPEMLFQFLRRWGSLSSDDGQSHELSHRLCDVRKNAESIFASLPDTSEVICRALSSKDALEIS